MSSPSLSTSLGLALASCSAVGSAMCDFGRKRLMKDGLDAATIVASVCLIEGLVGVLYFLVTTGSMPLPSQDFWLPALAAAAASALTTSLLAKANSENDISLCAPFSAALPVLQLLVTTFLLRDEAALPARKVAGVCIVTGSAMWLARAGRRKTGKDVAVPLLPPGAATVLFCCLVQSFSTKLDQSATKAAGSPVVYLVYAKMLSGLWATCGAQLLSARGAKGKEEGADAGKGAGRGASRRTLALLGSQPRLLLLLLGVTAMEAIYMSCYFASLGIGFSKVYVVAIKKGGNLLVNSVGGWVLFGESHEGRVGPVLGVVAGVVIMSV